MVNILKKYSRAAGDRIQWKKVEAMFDNSEIPKSAEPKVLGASRARHVSRSPPFVLNTQSDGHTNTMPTRTRYAIKMVVD
jgi:hypothetical protein